VLQTVPLNKLEQVVLMGRGVQMSTALLVDLLLRGVPVLLTNQRGSRHYATLSAGPSRFAVLRTQQLALVQDPARSLELARSIVQAKLTNQRTVLAATGWAAAPAAITQIDNALAQVAQVASVDVLRGYEGTGAAAYFGVWRTSLDQAWGFQGRAYYPPPDPVNALLSFGYTLALNEVQTAVQITGLDPYLGTFHVIEDGRPSLALDLLEEFRPVIDRLVLDLLTRQAVTRSHFERPARQPAAVYLNEAGRALFIDAYEALMQQRVRLPTNEHTTLRRVVLLQTQAAVRVIRGDQERYSGFVLA
jgi:CRISPR-associated protein Cas1